MSEKKFYLTTPIYYVNARPHIGHAYTTIVADVLARRHRLLGEDTFFLTGTDEHGQKIERSAAAAGIPPQQFADQVSKSFQDLWHRMGITNNDYIRTTSEKHKRGVQKLFSELYARDQIYLSSYTGQYSIGEEMFVDGPPGTIGPDGRPTETVTEENFFFRLSDYQRPLIDLIESGKLAITPESRRNEVLSFLRGNIASTLSEAATKENLSSENPSSRPEAASPQPQNLSSRPEAQSAEVERPAGEQATIAMSDAGNPYIVGALKDLSISRSSFTWGIPVPEPAASTAAQKHVIYVWLDALANYMTALGYGSDDTTLFDKFWPANLHLVGKEITRFHCVYWPAFLLAAGLPLPKAVTAHGWLLFEDSKMSKSKGNIVRTETILEGFGTLCPPPTALKGTGFSRSVNPSAKDAALAAEGIPAEPTRTDRDLFASDVLRYFLLREIPFGQDGSFSFDAMITRYNADLANGYGNLVSRTLKQIQQHQDGIVVAPVKPFVYASKTQLVEDNAERQVAKQITETDSVIEVMTAQKSLAKSFDNCRLEQLASDLAARVQIVDIYLSSHEPWKLIKQTDKESRRGFVEVLYTAAESIRWITALLYPILPFATAKVWAQLGLGDIETAARNGELTNLKWGGLTPGTKLGPLSPIFPRADKGLAQIMTDMENPAPTPQPVILSEARSAQSKDPDTADTANPAPAAEPLSITTPEAPAITIDDFAKIELRVAEIKLAERIPKADKLLRLEVDLGPLGQRQILSGIAEHYAPEDLIGRRIIVITNLAPRKMRGLESHGMLLAASEEGGKPFLATVPEGVPLGTRLK